MSIQVHMLEFLRSADFGGITLGMTRQQVLERCGDPSEWLVLEEVPELRESNLWKYRSIEFHFAEDRIWLIFSDHLPLLGSQMLQLDPWILRPGLTLPKAVAFFNDAKLIYTITTEQHTGVILVTFESSVILKFYLFDEKPDPELIGFSYKAAV